MTKNGGKPVICSQCMERPALFNLGEHPICIRCNLQVEEALTLQAQRLTAMQNDLMDDMEDVAGLHGVLTRHHIPQPVIHKGPMTFHNIRVDRSTVGAINTGQVQRLDAVVTHVREAGNEGLAEGLRELTQAVVDSTELADKDRAEVIELLSHLAGEVEKPKAGRSAVLAKSIMGSLDTVLSGASKLADLWSKVQPMMAGLF